MTTDMHTHNFYIITNYLIKIKLIITSQKVSGKSPLTFITSCSNISNCFSCFSLKCFSFQGNMTNTSHQTIPKFPYSNTIN